MILITGASGFIGRVLARRLHAQEYRIRALLRREVVGPWDEHILVDLEHEEVPPRFLEGVETVWHLAGVAHTSGVSEAKYYRVNVEGTRKLLRAAEAAGVKGFIYFSSIRATEIPPEGRCVDESWEVWPQDPYGRSKRMAESLVMDSQIAHAVVLRPALVYGAGIKGNLYLLLRLIASGWCPPLPDTHNRRAFVHVEDVATAAILAAQKPVANRKVYIVSEPRFYSTREIYERARLALGREVPRWSVPYSFFVLLGRLGDVGEGLFRRPLPWTSKHVQRLFGSSCYVPKRAQEELGWKPVHELLSSLQEMLREFSL